MKKKNILLELKNIRKEFVVSDSSKPMVVLKDISLKVYEGDSISIMGPSGSGKTTLLNILGTLDSADSGTYLYKNKEIENSSDDKLSIFRNTQIGFVFQLHHLLPQCTVLENVLLPSLPNNDKSTPLDRAKELLKKIGLEERFSTFPSQLSGGEMQRVSMARALINHPRLLLADEPTGSLDKARSEDLINLLLKLNREENFTLIIVSHSEELAKKLDKRYVLQDGILIPYNN